MSAEFACGQILFNVKNSNLHYMIKETHLRAYITIRKKLIKPSDEIIKITKNVENDVHVERVDRDVNNHITQLERENVNLRERNKVVETDLAFLRVELEEIELKNHDLLNKNSDLDDRIEELYRETHFLEQLKQEIENLKQENRAVKADCEQIDIAKQQLENTLEKRVLEIESLRKKLDKKESVAVLSCKTCEDIAKTGKISRIHTPDHTENSRPSTSMCGKCPYESDDEEDMNIHMNLNHASEHGSKLADVPTTSKCGECDYASGDESDIQKHIQLNYDWKCKVCSTVLQDENSLKDHIKKEHNDSEQKNQEVEVVKCPDCNFTADWNLDDHILDKHNFPCGDCSLIFRSLERLRNHMCKLPIKNPTFGTLYSKSWWDGNGCNPIFCDRKNQEVAWLHHDKCLSKVKTCYLAQNHLAEKDGTFHLEIDKYIIYCEIQWEALASKISK